MSRHETDREDLMREAVALRERLEIKLDTPPQVLVAGWRTDGRLSLYFDSDPVYHFDPQGGLRRAFVDGELYRSRGDTLSRLSRSRADGESSLIRHDLSDAELHAVLAPMSARIASVMLALVSGRFEKLRQVPVEGDLEEKLLTTLQHQTASRLAAALVRRK